MAMPAATPYTEAFQAAGVGKDWDAIVYSKRSYDSFIWSLQQPRLAQLVSAVRQATPTLKYLDFACGTGRVLAALEPLAAEAAGVDISPAMLAAARHKVARARLVQGDILQDPGLVDGDYDLITAFRFFLNTEPAMRQQVMTSLAQRLRRPSGRLVFNIHGNAASVLGLRRAGDAAPHTSGKKTLALAEVRRLVATAGLEIEAWYGYGLCPRRVHLTGLRPLAERVDRWASAQPALRGVSRDLLFVCRPAAARRVKG